jgi:hypothetical protein
LRTASRLDVLSSILPPRPPAAASPLSLPLLSRQAAERERLGCSPKCGGQAGYRTAPHHTHLSQQRAAQAGAAARPLNSRRLDWDSGRGCVQVLIRCGHQLCGYYCAHPHYGFHSAVRDVEWRLEEAWICRAKSIDAKDRIVVRRIVQKSYF